nr:MAG TPA: TIGR02594 family protein [Bacteriophage sp.]
MGFCVGQDNSGNLWILGGNQSNRVSVAKFQKTRVKAYIWLGKNGQPSAPLSERFHLPVLNLAGDFSKNEA